MCVECLHRAILRHSSAVHLALNILSNLTNKDLATVALLSGQSARAYDTHYQQLSFAILSIFDAICKITRISGSCTEQTPLHEFY
jgi:hypothetical protein